MDGQTYAQISPVFYRTSPTLEPLPPPKKEVDRRMKRLKRLKREWKTKRELAKEGEGDLKSKVENRS